jgi:nicotinamidase/pyrazinamidase
MKSKNALLIVDVQLDFCPGGALPIPEGDKLIPILNKYIKFFSRQKLPIFASRDWHSKHTKHFKQFGGNWPEHCVQNTQGAQFHPVLRLPKDTIILSKGMDPDEDSYSAFQAVDSQRNEFSTLLQKLGVTSLFIGGLATDYCVKWSVLDALKFGYKVTILRDAVKGVNIKPNDSEVSIEEMLNLGAQKTTFEKLYKTMSGNIK